MEKVVVTAERNGHPDQADGAADADDGGEEKEEERRHPERSQRKKEFSRNGPHPKV